MLFDERVDQIMGKERKPASSRIRFKDGEGNFQTRGFGYDPDNAEPYWIEVDKPAKILKAFGKDGELIAVYPASIGSAEKPAPSGTLKVTSIAQNQFWARTKLTPSPSGKPRSSMMMSAGA